MSSLRLLPAAALASALPDIWQGQEMARPETAAIPTGYPQLDAELPGAGWPPGLVEVLQERPEQHVWQLTGPSLVQLLQAQAGPVVLVGAPFEPFCPGLQARGIAIDRLLWIRAGASEQKLWATEQALRCADVCAVLAWLPQAKSAELRRLQISAQKHNHLLFVFRTLRSVVEASPARVRLQLSGTTEMEVRILKRRGPPLQNSLSLPAAPSRLAALLSARKRRPDAVAAPAGVFPLTAFTGIRSHVLDRIAALG